MKNKRCGKDEDKKKKMNMSYNIKNTIQNIQPLAAYENLLEAFLEVENQHNDNKSSCLQV